MPGSTGTSGRLSPMDDLPEAPPPSSVDLRRDELLEVVWPDGTRGRFALVDLRLACPCAECRGRRERGLAVWPTEGAPETLRAVDAQLVGGWGITLTWNDGHATGIYSWGLLRTWAAAGET
jgi:DUF971 family protein